MRRPRLTYRDARKALIDDLGIEPGFELRELEREILEHCRARAVRRRRSLGAAGPQPRGAVREEPSREGCSGRVAAQRIESRITTRLRRVSIQPSSRSSRIAFATASREAAVHAASSSCDSASVTSTPSSVGSPKHSESSRSRRTRRPTTSWLANSMRAASALCRRSMSVRTRCIAARAWLSRNLRNSAAPTARVVTGSSARTLQAHGPGDRADLADDVTRAAEREDDLLAGVRRGRHLRAAFEQDADAARLVAALDDRVACRVLANAPERAQLSGVAVGQRRQERTGRPSRGTRSGYRRHRPGRTCSRRVPGNVPGSMPELRILIADDEVLLCAGSPGCSSAPGGGRGRGRGCGRGAATSATATSPPTRSLTTGRTPSRRAAPTAARRRGRS